MPGRRTLSRVAVGITCVILTSCGKSPSGGGRTPTFVLEEEAFDAAYAASKIDLTGEVVDPDGRGVPSARLVTVARGDSSGNDGLLAETDAAGRFTFPSLVRRSLLVRVSADGYHDEVVAIDLQLPTGTAVARTATIVMTPRGSGSIRMLFGGDCMFGRRFLDRDEDGVFGEEEDLIREGSWANDASALLVHVRELVSSVDFAQVNLESPVSAGPSEIHPYKEYKFHSHPETLAALEYAGVDAVSLGNNHIYDLLESGMAETLLAVDSRSFGWFGAGMSETSARRSLLEVEVGGVPLALQGFNGIVPFNFPPWGPDPWPAEYLYNALDAPVVKGGSLGLTDANIDDFLARADDEHFRIPVFHGGFEYGEYPSGNMRASFERALLGGANLVVAHHPHTIYGIAHLRDVEDPAIALLSLGNFVFDQDVFETFWSFVAIVDMTRRGPGDHVVDRVRLVPFHIEGYVPKLVTGEMAARVGRHVGHISTHFTDDDFAGDHDDDLVGATVFPAGHRIAVCTDESEYQTVESLETREVVLEDGASEPIAYERLDPADSLVRVRSTAPAGCELGRDILRYGDFEDFDVDDDFHEVHLWNQSSVRFAENSVCRSGTGALVLLREAGDTDFAATWLRNRVTFREGSSLTVDGWMRRENAGPVEVVVRWFVRDERTVISTVLLERIDAGSSDWTRFSIDLDPPRRAGTVRVFVRHYAPDEGEGEVFLDDISIIQWERSIDDIEAGVDLAAPNDWSWIRLVGDDDGELGLTLTHRTYSLRPGSL